MRRRLVFMVLVVALALSVPAPAQQYMDCYPGKLYRKANPADSRCIIDHTNDCMFCTVTVTVE